MAGEPQDDCLFCKIAAGHVPATIVRETETTVAFRDINPQAPTHVLVIPKAHYPDAASLATAAPALAADVLRGRYGREQQHCGESCPHRCTPTSRTSGHQVSVSFLMKAAVSAGVRYCE